MAADLAARIEGRGHNVVVVTSRSRYSDHEDVGGNSAFETVYAQPFGARWRASAWVSFWLQSFFLLLTVEWDRAVVMTDPPFMLFAGAASKLFFPARQIYWWTMDLYPEALVASDRQYPFKRFVNAALAKLTNQALSAVDGVIALGKAQRDLLRRYPRWPENDRGFCVVEPPWDLRSIAADPGDVAGLRAEFGWSGRRVALYAGNLGEAHTFHEIIQVAESLQRAGDTDWIFAFFCRGSRVRALRERAAGLSNVTVHDYLDERRSAALLLCADVHLITMAEGWEGIIVPSKLYGVTQTTAPIVFIGPSAADTADAIRVGNLGVVLSSNVDADQFAKALASLPSARRAYSTADGPDRVAGFVASELGAAG